MNDKAEQNEQSIRNTAGPYKRIASGRTWWLTLPSDERGWRPAWWRLTERPHKHCCVFEHFADDGESGLITGIDAPWKEALKVVRKIIAANDDEHARFMALTPDQQHDLVKQARDTGW